MTGTRRILTAKVSIITLALSGALISAAPAHADRRSPAPIVFAGQGSAPATTRQQQPVRTYAQRSAPTRYQARQQAPAADPRTKRIEFRYPDNPNIVYDQNGAHQTSNAAPIAFSSSGAAIAPERARQYAKAEQPRMSAPQPRLDPAISRGGFDARATAARVEAASAVAMPPVQTPRAPQPVAAQSYAGQGAAVGVSYSPVGDTSYDESGLASWYGEDFHGQPTANGEIFDMEGMTAAHPSLPLPSLVQVINLENGREVVVRVNDRGPFVDGRIMDVSARAANVLGFQQAGQANIRVKYLGPAPVVPTNAAAPASAPAVKAPPAQYAAPAPQTQRPVMQQAAVQPLREMPRMEPIPNPVVSGDFYVQVGSFSDIGNAQNMVRSLGNGMPVEIVPVQVRGSDFFRVMVGPMDMRATANDVRDRLDYDGIANGMVVTKPQS